MIRSLSMGVVTDVTLTHYGQATRQAAVVTVTEDFLTFEQAQEAVHRIEARGTIMPSVDEIPTARRRRHRLANDPVAMRFALLEVD